MNRKIGISIIVIIIVVMMSITAIAAPVKNIDATFNSISLIVDGKKANADNILYAGTTYVPLRATAELLGMNVKWEEATKTANISAEGEADDADPVKGTGISGKKNIGVKLNTINIVVEGKKISADNILYNGTTYAPMRATAEALGKKVDWDGETYTATIGKTGVVEDKKDVEEKLTEPKEVISKGKYDWKDPAPIGVVQNYIKESEFVSSITYSANISVEDVVTGIEARNMLDIRPYDEPGLEGKDIVVITYKIKLNSTGDENASKVFSANDFKFYEVGKNEPIDTKSYYIKGVNKFSKKIEVGETAEFKASYSMDSGLGDIILGYESPFNQLDVRYEHYKDDMGIWFKLD